MSEMGKYLADTFNDGHLDKTAGVGVLVNEFTLNIRAAFEQLG